MPNFFPWACVYAHSVVPALVSIADTMRIANKECSHLICYTKVDDLAGRFMTLIADTPKRTLADFVLGTVQFLPTTRILPAQKPSNGTLCSVKASNRTGIAFIPPHRMGRDFPLPG
jgi:hypothetical protein